MGGVVEGLIWKADFSKADSAAAGFVDVHRQIRGGKEEGDDKIRRGGDPIPVKPDAPSDLGRALVLHLADSREKHPEDPENPDGSEKYPWDDDRRLEALPGGGMDLVEGMHRWFRVDFALGADYPLDNPPGWGPLINQIHQAGSDGSPPVSFVVRNRQLILTGGDNTGRPPYSVTLPATIVKGQKYQLVYGVTFSEDPSKSWCDVWLDGQPLKEGINVTCGTIYGGPVSYWKGATLYMSPDNAPATIYQNAHRVGTTREAVMAD